MNSIIIEMLKEAYFLLKDVDQFGADDSPRRQKISEWLNVMEKITIGDIIFQSTPPPASLELPQDPSAPSSHQ
jgi:hypothetical protein